MSPRRLLTAFLAHLERTGALSCPAPDLTTAVDTFAERVHRGRDDRLRRYVSRGVRASDGAGDTRERCARDSDWCDGYLCRERGIDCPNAEPADG